VSSCHLPAPWLVRELEQALRIEDANGQAVAYAYFRKDENEARQANVLTTRPGGSQPTSPSCLSGCGRRDEAQMRKYSVSLTNVQ
jgi:hypothetical protein